MFLKVQPLGVNVLSNEDRIPVWLIASGDDWVLNTRLTLPEHPSTGATPSTSKVTFVLAEDRFSKTPLWTGHWDDGIVPVDPVNHPGLVNIRVPDSVTDTLRRGTYAFSVTVSDMFGRGTKTVLSGHVLVEYEPTSPTHDIPYRSTP